MEPPQRISIEVNKENIDHVRHLPRSGEIEGSKNTIFYVRDTVYGLLDVLSFQKMKDLLPKFHHILEDDFAFLKGMRSFQMKLFGTILNLFHKSLQLVKDVPETLIGPTPHTLKVFEMDLFIPESGEGDVDILDLVHSIQRLRSLFASCEVTFPTMQAVPNDSPPDPIGLELEKKKKLKELWKKFEKKSFDIAREDLPALKKLLLEYEKEVTVLLSPDYSPPPDSFHSLLELYEPDLLRGPRRIEVTVNNLLEIRKRAIQIWIGIFLLLILGIVVWKARKIDSEDPSIVSQPTEKVPEMPEAMRNDRLMEKPDWKPLSYELLVGDNPMLGANDAPITLVEFSDLQCPYTRRFYEETYQKIYDAFIKTGKMKMVLREFPLSSYPDSMRAAIALECARKMKGDEGYIKMRNRFLGSFPVVISRQASSLQYSIPLDLIKKSAFEDLNFDGKDFLSLLNAPLGKEGVEEDMNAGEQLNINATPTFILTDGKTQQKISGNQPFENLKKAIEDLKQ